MKLKLIALLPALLTATACADATTPPELAFPAMAPISTLAAQPPARYPTSLTSLTALTATAATPTAAPAAAPQAAPGADSTELAMVAPVAPIVAAAPAAAPQAATADTTISIRDFAFAPRATTVTAGTTVHWKNLDGEPHTVRAIDTTFASNALDQDDTFAVKFDQPGTYKYICSIHPQMTGTIVVEAAN
jgi:plastocyanin